jgi:uncharacterized damage-inducible protein DinB
MPPILEQFELIKFGRKYLLDALAQCTNELLDFAPAVPGGRRIFNLREQFLHIADVGELFVYASFLDGDKPEDSWRVAEQEDGSFNLRGMWPTVDNVRAELEKSWAFQDEHVFGRDSADLAQPVGPRGFILAEEIGWLIFHESQHRGQIMMYLRLAGAEPPKW